MATPLNHPGKQEAYSTYADVKDALYQLGVTFFSFAQALGRTIYFLVRLLFSLYRRWHPLLMRYAMCCVQFILHVVFLVCHQIWFSSLTTKFILLSTCFSLVFIRIIISYGIFSTLRKAIKRKKMQWERRRHTLKTQLMYYRSQLSYLAQELKTNYLSLVLLVLTPRLLLSPSHSRLVFNWLFFMVPVVKTFVISLRSPPLFYHYSSLLFLFNDKVNEHQEEEEEEKTAQDIPNKSRPRETPAVALCLNYWVADCCLDLGFSLVFFMLRYFLFSCFPSLVLRRFGTLSEGCLLKTVGTSAEGCYPKTMLCDYLRCAVLWIHDLFYASTLIFWLTSQPQRLRGIYVSLTQIFDTILVYLLGIRVSFITETCSRFMSWMDGDDQFTQQSPSLSSRGVVLSLCSQLLALCPKGYQNYLCYLMRLPQMVLFFLPSFFMPLNVLLMKLLYPLLAASLALKHKKSDQQSYWIRYFMLLYMYEKIFTPYVYRTRFWAYVPLAYHMELLGIIALQLVCHPNIFMVFITKVFYHNLRGDPVNGEPPRVSTRRPVCEERFVASSSHKPEPLDRAFVPWRPPATPRKPSKGALKLQGGSGAKRTSRQPFFIPSLYATDAPYGSSESESVGTVKHEMLSSADQRGRDEERSDLRSHSELSPGLVPKLQRRSKDRRRKTKRQTRTRSLKKSADPHSTA